MDKAALREKIFWNLQANWHLRRRPTVHELSIQETVKGLQHILLDQRAAMLRHTLEQIFAAAVRLEDLQRLEIALYQEGADQRVWRARATLIDGRSHAFGLIVARAPGDATAVTQRDFHHLQTLYGRQRRYCVQPYVAATIPIADGVAAHTVEWLTQHKELVFEIARDGGVFLINAHAAHDVFTPLASRRIWRHLIAILWCYSGLVKVNIQAGDFVVRQRRNGLFELKLTTARELRPKPDPAAHLQMLLRTVITASGYLSDGRRPFDRQMSKTVFQHRMQALLQRRFGKQAERLAQQQWLLFQNGAFAQQEDWLKEDCILATYDFLQATESAVHAWQKTRQYWMDYVDAVRANRYPDSWWFPSAEIPAVLNQLTPADIHREGDVT